MSNDIAEFLRRAAQRYAQQQAPTTVTPEILEAEVVEDAEIIDSGDSPGDDVAAHVRQQIDTSAFSRRAATLGAEVDQSDDRLEAHLNQVFEHRLGQLSGRPAQQSTVPTLSPITSEKTPEKTAVPASDVKFIDLLRDKNQFRNAVVLSEILRRPKF